ncbi:uncharacterized protein BDCG_16875 [Blastomyces dermatitidis ER-3]|uniref:Uncharacterized protein n=3 Tax=Blastomyces TaxID=229219 RepID=A0A179U9G8_BLAGS|nr:uncharacterized protein BDBG_16300 [Blastomyces gilchristii SLH14081]XP_045276055.1 uncharacterized protein BDCG_16875 [Blastomyces dermatitidis ER-3]EEQ89052.2 hypothetical protein BDCG_16875 [Blastomyces dermatitidis ER-3]KMW67572.1 hypothetical protein BDDG_12195 [Blastomyces dermatitidis ATCC 18188]OAT04645.1 hypothetical protein BDBG_16300 [Blastomyces gilchristii SLH14081]
MMPLKSKALVTKGIRWNSVLSAARLSTSRWPLQGVHLNIQSLFFRRFAMFFMACPVQVIGVINANDINAQKLTIVVLGRIVDCG